MRETKSFSQQDPNMPSCFNESITIEEAIRKPTCINKSPQTSRTVSYNTNTDSSLTRDAMPRITHDSLSSMHSLNSSFQQTNRRRTPHKNVHSQRSDTALTPNKRNPRIMDPQQSISQDLKKSSRTLVKHTSSAGSFLGGWSSADLSGRSDWDDNVVETKFKSRRKLQMLMQNIEMEKKKDLVLKSSSMHPNHNHQRPLHVGEFSKAREEWKKPNLDDTLSKDAPMRRFRLFCGELVEDPRVQLFIIILILLNAIMMGIATFDFVTNDQNTNRAFDITDKVFLTIFTIESTLQLIYRGPSLFKDRWLVFDFVIVVISWTLESLQIIRAFRVFRAIRLVTRLVALKSLLMALGDVLPRIYAITTMLVLVFYIYAVLFVELFGDLKLSTNYFDTLPNALLTCMQLMTLEWAELAREVMDYYDWAGIVFCSFISITGFIVFNLIVAVVCDAVSIIDKKIRKEEEEYSEEMKLLKQPNANESENLTAQQKWMKAQKRINELTLELEEMKENQLKLVASITKLAKAWQGQDSASKYRRNRRGINKFGYS